MGRPNPNLEIQFTFYSGRERGYFTETLKAEKETLIDDFPSGHYRCFICPQPAPHFDSQGVALNGVFEEGYDLAMIKDPWGKHLITVCKRCYNDLKQQEKVMDFQDYVDRYRDELPVDEKE